VHPVIIGTCDNCDLQEVQSLSAKLLSALTEASIHENSGALPSDVVTNTLKEEFLSFLGFGRIIQSSSSPITLNPLSVPRDLSIDLDPSLDIRLIQSRLERGAFVSHLQSKKSAWGKVSDPEYPSFFLSHSSPVFDRSIYFRLLPSSPLMALRINSLFAQLNWTVPSSRLLNDVSLPRD
jgi:hypothetical protein